MVGYYKIYLQEYLCSPKFGLSVNPNNWGPGNNTGLLQWCKWINQGNLIFNFCLQFIGTTYQLISNRVYFLYEQPKLWGEKTYQITTTTIIYRAHLYQYGTVLLKQYVNWIEKCSNQNMRSYFYIMRQCIFTFYLGQMFYHIVLLTVN